MIITEIKTHFVRVPYIEPMAISVATIPTGTSTIVQVFTDEGIIGVGETIGYGDTITAIETQVSPLVIGEDPFNIEKILLKYLHSTRVLLADLEGACYAIGAVEMAIWDIIGKKLGKPIYQLIGGKFRDNVPITAFMTLKNFDDIVNDAEEAMKQGFKTIKIKVGRDLYEDIDLVATIRERVGPKIELRVDANGAWSVGTAIRQIRKLEKYDPQYIEQPIPRFDMNGLAYVRGKSRIPIAVCEGGLTLYRLAEIIRNKAADVISTDPLRLGGILQFKKACHMAEACDIPIVTHIDRLGISKAAWLHVCISTPNVMFANDIIASNAPGFKGSVNNLVNVTFEHKGGGMKVLEQPGLGVMLDEESLAKYKVEDWQKVCMPGKKEVFTSPSY